ncbi:MAG TPA: hypothetical protein VN426_10980 [Syntrophomonadaceae bacterium]|nr:hypothetical protein [Syntrophomonadaceae bacterium]
MSFNLVLDEPVEGDKVEEHEGLQFVVESGLYDSLGPFTLTSIRRGKQLFFQIDAAKQSGESAGCDSCTSCG